MKLDLALAYATRRRMKLGSKFKPESAPEPELPEMSDDELAAEEIPLEAGFEAESELAPELEPKSRVASIVSKFRKIRPGAHNED